MLNEIGYALQELWNNGTYTFSTERNELDHTDYEYIKKVVTELMDGQQMEYEVKELIIKVLP